MMHTPSTANHRRTPFSAVLFPLALLLKCADAQSSAATTPLPSADASATPSTANPTPSTFSISPRSSLSSFLPSSPTATPSAFDIQPTATRCPEGDCGDDDGSSTDSYYFVFIAIFFVLLVVGLWFGNQRRRKHNVQSTNTRRSALSRDMRNNQFDQLFPNARRPTAARSREGRRSRSVNPPPAEGLNEAGEAPPPYKKDGVNVGGVDDAGLTIPMQTLQRDEHRNSKPPEYDAPADGYAAGRVSSDLRRPSGSGGP